ncbi:MAG: hypothetical protein WC712_12080 [Candidatus Brocadiia bacterium]
MAQDRAQQGAVLLVVAVSVAAFFVIVVCALTVATVAHSSSHSNSLGLVARMAADSALDVCIGTLEDFRLRHPDSDRAMLTISSSPSIEILEDFIRTFDDCTEPQGRLGDLRRADRRSVFSASCDINSPANFPYRGMGSKAAALTYFMTVEVDLSGVTIPVPEDLAGGPKDCGLGSWTVELFGNGAAIFDQNEPFPAAAQMLAWGKCRLGLKVMAELDSRQENVFLKVFFPEPGELVERRFRSEAEFPDMPKWNWSKLSIQ